MTGYQEILTDPSYCRQIVTLTYPHIGNTGANAEDVEADRVYAAGSDRARPAACASRTSAPAESLADYLRRENVVAISDIDTRRLTRILRDKGAQAGAILVGTDEARAVELARSFPGMSGLDLAKVVSVEAPYEWTETAWQLGAGYGRLANGGYTWSPTTSASSATSCDCWPTAAAASRWCRRRPRPPRCGG